MYILEGTTIYVLLTILIYSSFPQVEVFNVLFIKEQEKRHVVHCLSCALKLSPSLQGIVCLEEYRLSELQHVYDSFSLHRTQGLAYTQ